MFIDWLDSLLTRCPRTVRAMGYPREIIGIRNRYRRCSQHWLPHIERCHDLILRGVARCEHRRKAIVLGAALLQDVPIDELSKIFREVLLVDVVHPFFARRATGHLRNVKRITADITNTIAETYRLAWDRNEPLPVSKPTLFLDDPEIDFTVSVNLLSQLPCMPLSYLTSQNAHSKTKIEDFVRHLMQAHLDYLAKMPGRVTLITDVERLKYTQLGQIVERRDLFFGLRFPRISDGSGEEWEWKLAPSPEVDRMHHYYRRVVGVVNWK